MEDQSTDRFIPWTPGEAFYEFLAQHAYVNPEISISIFLEVKMCGENIRNGVNGVACVK